MKKQAKSYESGSAVIAVLMLILLAAGLVVSLKLVNIQQIFKSKASSANASLGLPANKSVAINQEFEVPVILETGGEEIVAADVVLNFDKTSLQLIDIVEKPHSNNKLTTYIPRNGSFNKTKIVTDANYNGTIDFGAVCFGAGGCPEGQKQNLGEENPLAGLKFKAVKAGASSINVLYSPSLTTNSNLINRNKQNVLGKTTPLSLTITQTTPTDAPTAGTVSIPTPTPSPVVSAPVTTLTLSKTSGFVNGEAVSLYFNATRGAAIIHTSIWEGINNSSQKWDCKICYQGLSGSGGTRTAKVPFYVEYLAVSSQGNKENTKTMSVTAVSTPAPTFISTPVPSADVYTVSGWVKNSNGQFLAGVSVEVHNDSGGSKVVVTDTNGKFIVTDVAQKRRGYGVSVLKTNGVSSVKTAVANYVWNFAGPFAGLDTPLGMESYEFQLAGSNDCAGPDNNGVSGRCGFEVAK